MFDFTGKSTATGKEVTGHYWTDNIDKETHYIQTYDPDTLRASEDIEVHADSIRPAKGALLLKTAIAYHPDECPGCVHIHHQKDQYNIIFKCNECGDQRKLVLDPSDDMSFPIGLTSPANDCEIKQ